MSRDEGGQAEDVGQQDEFLASIVGDVADIGEELDGGEPLVFGEFDVTCEGVQVLDQGGHDGAQARIAALLHGGQHGLGDGVFVDVAHGCCPLEMALTLRQIGTLCLHCAEKNTCQRKEFSVIWMNLK